MTDIDQFPSYMTWMGTALVMIGIYLIQKADNRRISDMEEEDNLETIDEIELQDKNSDKLSENDGKQGIEIGCFDYLEPKERNTTSGK